MENMNEYIAFYGFKDKELESDEIPEAIVQFKAEDNKKALDIAKEETEKWNDEEGFRFSLIKILKVEEVV